MKLFFLSTHQINFDKPCCKINYDTIVQYFCFPEYGLAMAMRVEDILFFNANAYHCLSIKTNMFKDIDVHVSTFYLKTAHVGMNDNSILLTENQTIFYSMKL